MLELHQRFSGRNGELMKAIHASNPHCFQFLDPEQLQPLADCYNLDSESLNMESKLDVLSSFFLANILLHNLDSMFLEG